jgi:glycosyltransferase involved in cell wall biosynthesis
VIAGDGHLRTDLEREAAELDLADSLVFLGNRTDTDAVYAGVDIVALTSLNEGTPLSLIEAMAARRPVISTRVGGVRDLLGDPVGSMPEFDTYSRGIGLAGRSPDEFAKGLIYLAKNEKLRERFALEGREYVEAQYSKERLIDDIKRLYRKLTVKS